MAVYLMPLHRLCGPTYRGRMPFRRFGLYVGPSILKCLFEGCVGRISAVYYELA